MPDAPTQPSSTPGSSGDGNGGGAGNDGGQQQPGQGTPPAQTPPAAGDVDLTKLPADQLQKALENPELWNLPRIKELRDAQAELKKLQDDSKKSADKQLEEQKKFQELATKRGEENAQLQQKIQGMAVDQQLTNKLAPLGVVNLEDALKLIDRSAVKVKDDGTVEGVDAAVEALKKDKAYLFGQAGSTTSVGTPSNPAQGNQPGGPAKFKRSQLQDPKFYAENRDAIVKAAQAGQIEDDITPHQQR